MKNSLFLRRIISAIRYPIILLFAFLLSFALTTNASAVDINIPSCNPINIKSSEGTSVTTARIKSISSDQSMMQIQCRQEGDLITTAIAVKAPVLKSTLQSFTEGDQVTLQLSQDNELQSLSIKVYEVSWFTRIVTIIGVILLLLFIFWLFLKSGLRNLIVGADNRFSY